MKSGSKKDRKLIYSTFEDFYHNAYVQAATKANHSIRSIQTIINWLHDLDILPSVFDRYRCAVCFEGRMAELAASKTKEQEVAIKKYKVHHVLVEHQLAQVKLAKASIASNTLVVIYDYTTFHDFTKKKVFLQFT